MTELLAQSIKLQSRVLEEIRSTRFLTQQSVSHVEKEPCKMLPLPIDSKEKFHEVERKLRDEEFQTAFVSSSII